MRSVMIIPVMTVLWLAGLAGCGLRQEVKEAPSELSGPLLFDDFETGALGGGGWSWGDPVSPGTCTFSVANTGVKFGKNCGKMDYRPGKGWGCGAAEASPIEGRGLKIAAAKKIVLWIKAPDTLKFNVALTSRTDDRIVSSLSPVQQGLGRWWKYEIPLDQFVLLLPQDASGSGGKTGNVDSVGLFIPGGQKDGVLTLDDISFQ